LLLKHDLRLRHFNPQTHHIGLARQKALLELVRHQTASIKGNPKTNKIGLSRVQAPELKVALRRLLNEHVAIFGNKSILTRLDSKQVAIVQQNIALIGNERGRVFLGQLKPRWALFNLNNDRALIGAGEQEARNVGRLRKGRIEGHQVDNQGKRKEKTIHY
jgi:hypothetical protein